MVGVMSNNDQYPSAPGVPNPYGPTDAPRPSLDKAAAHNPYGPSDAGSPPAAPQYGSPDQQATADSAAPRYGSPDQAATGDPAAPQYGSPDQPTMAGQGAPPQQPALQTPRGSGRQFARGGVWLIAVGLFILIGNLGINLSGHLWGFALLVPMAIALATIVPEYRRTGVIAHGHLWWLFGTAFPAVAGIGIVLGFRHINFAFVVAIGFVAVGVWSILGRSGTGLDARRLSDRHARRQARRAGR